MSQEDELMAAATAEIVARKMLFMGMERTPAATLDLFRDRCSSLSRPQMQSQDMPKVEMKLSVFGILVSRWRRRWQDCSVFMTVSIMSIQYVAVQANILLFMAKDQAKPGEFPDFSVHAFLCQSPQAAQEAGRELTQSCLTVHTGFREIKRRVEDGALDADGKEASDMGETLARATSALSVVDEGVEEVETFGFGADFDFQSEAQLGEYMETLAENQAAEGQEVDYFDPMSLRSPETKKMMSGKAKADANFIHSLSRQMSKRRVSFSGGLVMSAEAQATVKRAVKIGS